jgi:hypothetical protein
MIIAPFAVSAQLRSTKSWRNYSRYSIATGILAAVLVPLYVLEVFVNWNGAIQRIILAALLLWIVAIAIRLLRSPTHQDELNRDRALSARTSEKPS